MKQRNKKTHGHRQQFESLEVGGGGGKRVERVGEGRRG